MATGLKSLHLLRGTDQRNGQVDYELLIPPTLPSIFVLRPGDVAERLQETDAGRRGSGGDVATWRTVMYTSDMRGPITLTDVRNGHVEIASISGDVH